ncbi:MAG: Ig-like domain-containing protein [Reichenbachiella sp.]
MQRIYVMGVIVWSLVIVHCSKELDTFQAFEISSNDTLAYEPASYLDVLQIESELNDLKAFKDDIERHPATRIEATNQLTEKVQGLPPLKERLQFTYNDAQTTADSSGLDTQIQKVDSLIDFYSTYLNITIGVSSATTPPSLSSSAAAGSSVTISSSSVAMSAVSSQIDISAPDELLSSSGILESSATVNIESSLIESSVSELSSSILESSVALVSSVDAVVSSSSTVVLSSSSVVINTAPRFNPLTASMGVDTDMNSPVTIDLNAIDDEGDAITWSIKSGSEAALGTVVLPSGVGVDKSIVYTPNTGVSGNDDFTIVIRDVQGLSVEIEITVTINLTIVDTNFVLTLDGVDDFVDLPDTDFDFTNGITIESWVKYVTHDGYMRIIEWGNGVANDNFYLTVDNINTNSMYFRVYDVATGVSKVYANDILSGVGTSWVHIAMTLAADGTVKFYKNGVEHTDITGGPSSIPNTVTRLHNFIGNSNWDSDPEMNGSFDEMRVWQTVRTGAEILANMNVRLVGVETGLKHLWSFDDGVASTVTDEVSAQHNGTLINTNAAIAWSVR